MLLPALTLLPRVRPERVFPHDAPTLFPHARLRVRGRVPPGLAAHPAAVAAAAVAAAPESPLPPALALWSLAGGGGGSGGGSGGDGGVGDGAAPPLQWDFQEAAAGEWSPLLHLAPSQGTRTLALATPAGTAALDGGGGAGGLVDGALPITLTCSMQGMTLVVDVEVAGVQVCD